MSNSKEDLKFTDISSETKEGKCLQAAIAMLTMQPELVIDKTKYNGKKMTPVEIMEKINILKERMFA